MHTYRHTNWRIAPIIASAIVVQTSTLDNKRGLSAKCSHILIGQFGDAQRNLKHFPETMSYGRVTSEFNNFDTSNIRMRVCFVFNKSFAAISGHIYFILYIECFRIKTEYIINVNVHKCKPILLQSANDNKIF